MQDFKKIKVWEKAHEMTLLIYQVTKAFPKEEMYGLVSQLRRASSSVATNIVEGCGRNGDREFAQFLRIAFASAIETEYHLLLARDLKYLNTEIYNELNKQLIEVKRMLVGFLKQLK